MTSLNLQPDEYVAIPVKQRARMICAKLIPSVTQQLDQYDQWKKMKKGKK